MHKSVSKQTGLGGAKWTEDVHQSNKEYTEFRGEQLVISPKHPSRRFSDLGIFQEKFLKNMIID